DKQPVFRKFPGWPLLLGPRGRGEHQEKRDEREAFHNPAEQAHGHDAVSRPIHMPLWIPVPVVKIERRINDVLGASPELRTSSVSRLDKSVSGRGCRVGQAFAASACDKSCKACKRQSIRREASGAATQHERLAWCLPIRPSP